MKPKKKSKPAPLVSSISTMARSTIVNNGVTVTTSEETAARKTKFLSILDKATDQFVSNLENNKVELNNSLDLERIVKLVLLLSGEADSITGATSKGEIQADVSTDAKLSMSKINEILDMNDPAVLGIFNRLYEGYNQINDAENVQNGK